MIIPPGIYNGSAKGIRVSGRLPKSCTLSCEKYVCHVSMHPK